MAMKLKPETEARIVDLATRLGFQGPDAQDRVLTLALDSLETQTTSRGKRLTPGEIAEEGRKLGELSAIGRRWREEHPEEYDESNPPSIAWQKELYGDDGLPK